MPERKVVIYISKDFRNKLNQLKGNKTYEEYIKWFMGDKK